ncbi:hypothetical protein U0070_012768 [Myodes glareolus]|uniref:Uncharacterized protein n=1 Tax=Myodes glareolus TaxID=447135 RepID=A0AAW0HDG6_MYOGA
MRLDWGLVESLSDNLQANYPNSDRYFSARGILRLNRGELEASGLLKYTSKKYFQGLLNRNFGLESLESTKKAEEWGRSGKNPNYFRPNGLPEKF